MSDRARFLTAYLIGMAVALLLSAAGFWMIRHFQ